jgi:beta-galactosidase
MQRQRFDEQWRFHFGDPSEWWGHVPDVSVWRVVDLPHDWSIELDRDPQNPCGSSGGFFTMGRGWYHKTFNAPDTWRDKKVFLEFEGVYMNTEVWLNGALLGRHPYGYTSFGYDLTPSLNVGGENVLRVMVDNSYQRNSRWYSGSGIYRHVWLMVTDPVHVAQWGVFVTTPEASPEMARVHVEMSVVNDKTEACEAIVRASIVAPDGMVVGSTETVATLTPGNTHIYTQDLTMAQPKLWSPDMPSLYWLETVVIANDRIVDTATTPFGIRSLHFDAQTGFLLNGQPTLLKGGCVHHDNGVMGSAAYDRSEERKVEVLKASGFNAIRCAHNPPSPAFLDACDRLGMLVIDEAFDCWRVGKNPGDYHASFDDWWQRDLESMLYRDRNHPSVIMWSIGNEVHERAGQSNGLAVARMLADHVRAVDPTRPVTSAINGGHTAWPWEQTDSVFAALDVGGYNYQQRQYRPDHERHPQRVMYGSESTAKEAFEHWMDVLDFPYVIGDFIWTSLDYLGEAGIGRVFYEGEPFSFLGAYPWNQANCGDLDLCGFKRPQSYYRDVLWGSGDPLYIAVHYPVPEGKTLKTTYWGWPDVDANWTWPGQEDKTFQVDVYSACEQVELLLNGASLGVQPTTRAERFMATFSVPYAPGALRAVGYKDGQPIAERELHTVGTPTGIRLTPDHSRLAAENGDLSFVTVEIVDAEGRMCPHVDHPVFFTVAGVGTLAAVGNGNPASTEAYRGNQRRAYRGRCLAVVQANGAPGEIHLRAQADGLEVAEVVIQVAG